MSGITKEILYKDTSRITSDIDENINRFLLKIIGEEEETILNTIRNWETKIAEDLATFNVAFNKKRWQLFQKIPTNFRDNVFRTLWTVDAALRSPDPELARYKLAYFNTAPIEIFNTYRNIVEKVENYINNDFEEIDFSNIESVDNLKQDFFHNENMFLTGVIGFGIRSEFLHKHYPHIFSLMTRRSHWGMYFLTSAEEFIQMEKGYGKHTGEFRFVNQYSYDYPRFNFYSYNISQIIFEYVHQKTNIKLNKEIQMAYANYFISEIFQINKSTYQLYNEWRKR
jgi:hypothetical protein